MLLILAVFQMLAEDYVLVLDYLSRGRGTGFRAEPLVQAIGTKYFTLLELVPKESAQIKIMDKLYVGKDERDKIDHIKRRIESSQLTTTAASEFEKAIEKIVREDEQRFVEFFNKSAPISLKRHQLELLPGLGNKHMMAILKEREIAPFTSYENIEKRVRLMPDPVATVVGRIMDETKDSTQKHYLFTRPPPKEHEQYGKKGGWRKH